MSRIHNWAEECANSLELCVYIGENWAILKDGTNQKGLYKKIDPKSPGYEQKLSTCSEFNGNFYENMCDLPSLYFEGKEFQGGVLLYAELHNKTTKYFLMGNNDKLLTRIDIPNLSVKIDDNLIVFTSTETNEEVITYDINSFKEIIHAADGQIGFNF